MRRLRWRSGHGAWSTRSWKPSPVSGGLPQGCPFPAAGRRCPRTRAGGTLRGSAWATPWSASGDSARRRGRRGVAAGSFRSIFTVGTVSSPGDQGLALRRQAEVASAARQSRKWRSSGPCPPDPSAVPCRASASPARARVRRPDLDGLRRRGGAAARTGSARPSQDGHITARGATSAGLSAAFRALCADGYSGVRCAAWSARRSAPVERSSCRAIARYDHRIIHLRSTGASETIAPVGVARQATHLR
jgi:hypothetical protein